MLTNDGLKLWHKCTHCEKRLYILYHRRNLGVSLFVEANPHQEHTPNDYFIPEKTKLKVLELAETYKTKYICEWLRDNLRDGYIELKPEQVFNLLLRKKSKANTSKMTLKDLHDWCNERMCIPEDPDELFIAEFHFDLETGEFHVFVTTKRLLLAATFTVHICADTTYNIMWQSKYFI